MRSIFVPIKALIQMMHWVSCVGVLSIMFLTVSDIILRRLKKPIEFTYEVVVLLGAIVIAFAIPKVSSENGHVIMDFLLVKLPASWRRVFGLITRCLGIATFGIIGSNMIIAGRYLSGSGQVSPILEIPEYPVVYAVAFACFVECIILFHDLLRRLRGEGS